VSLNGAASPVPLSDGMAYVETTDNFLIIRRYRVMSVVETRSQRQIGTQSTREAFGIVGFIVRRENIFAKVKSRHFRRANLLGQRAR